FLLRRAWQRDDAIALAAVGQHQQVARVIADRAHPDAIVDMGADIVLAIGRQRLDMARRERHRDPRPHADQARGQRPGRDEAKMDHVSTMVVRAIAASASVATGARENIQAMPAITSPMKGMITHEMISHARKKKDGMASPMPIMPRPVA